MKKNILKRLLSLALVLVMVVGLMPMSTLTASAANISTTSSTIQKGHYIYFGSSGQKWRVLDNAKTSTGGSGMFLWSVNSLGKTAPSKNYSSDVTYSNNGLKGWCTNYVDGNNFTVAEKAAILSTNKTADTGTFRDGSYTRNYGDGALNGDKLFLLSASEALNTAYFADNAARICGVFSWYLRSICLQSTGRNMIATVGNNGGLYAEPNMGNYPMHPAFNLDTSKILFVTAATGGKSSGLTAVSTSGSEWKLTLKDSNSFANGASISKTTLCAGQSVTLTHKALSAISADYTNVTAAIFSGDTMLFYGSVNTNTSATSSTVTLPADLTAGSYTLKLYGEDWNGDKRTDIATGTPYSVNITVQKHTGGSATCASQAICDNCMQGYGELSGEHEELIYACKEGTTNVLEETCAENCGHIATATMTPYESEVTFVPGVTIGGAIITFSDNWVGNQMYYLSFEDHGDVGTATVTATVYASPANALSCQYQILPADISHSFAQCWPGVYNGNPLNPEVYYRSDEVSLGNGTKLTEGQDYTIEWDQTDLTQAGEYNLTVTGIGNFIGSFTQKITTKPADLKNVSVVNNIDTFDYTGEAHLLDVTASGEAVDGAQVTFTYRVGESGEYVAAPSVTNGGTYTVYWKASAPNHNDTTGSFPVTVNPVNGDSSVSIADWVYGDTASAPVPVSTTNGTDHVTYLYKVKGADDSTYTAAVPTLPGEYTVKATFAATANYKQAEATADFAITKRPITVKATDVSKTYGDETDPALTWTVTSGSVAGSDVLDVNIERAQGENAGTYEITVSQSAGANENYEITFEKGIFTINKAALTITAENKTATYGNAAPQYTVTGSGFKYGDAFVDLDGTLAFACDYAQFSDKGTYAITPSGYASDNYEITYVPGELTVSPKAITVTITDKTGVYGEEIAELTATDDGIVNNDENVYSLTTSATDTTDVGTYAITGTALDANYAITFVDGTYTITKAVATATAPTAEELTYNGSQQTLIAAGATNDGDLVYALEKEGTYTAELPKAETAGTYTVWYKVIGDGNHTDSEPASIAVKIAKADPGIGAVTAGVVNNTLNTSAIVLTRANTNISGTLTVDAGQSLAVGANTIRYTFTPNDGTNYKTVKGEVNVTVADTVAPTGTVKLSTNSWTKFLNNITFGLLFKQTQTVSVSASDNLSGVAKIEYIESKSAMSLAAVQAATQWKEMRGGSVQVALENGKQFVYYIRITDKSGNVTYLSTNGAQYDTAAPVIAGVYQGVTYYTTQRVTVTDKNLDTITLNGRTVSDTFTLAGNKEASYTIVATDKAGNTATVTVKMAPIADISAGVEGKTEEDVTSDEKDNLQQIVDTTTDLLENEDMTESERDELEKTKADAEEMLDAVEEAAQAIDTENTAEVEDVTAENVEPEDKEDLENALEDLEKALEENGDNYTPAEKNAINNEIQRIEDALEIVENVEAVEDAIADLPETVAPGEEENIAKLEAAKKAYEDLSEYEKSLVDKKVKEKLDQLTAAAGAYDIIEGDEGQWSKKTGSGLDFTTNGPISKFVGVEIDGQMIDSKHYTAQADGTISLNESYLETLPVGEHTIAVVYTDGEAEGTFEIVETEGKCNILWWILAIIVCLVAIVVILITQKKKKHVK